MHGRSSARRVPQREQAESRISPWNVRHAPWRDAACAMATASTPGACRSGTHGGTEPSNLLIYCVVKKLRPAEGRLHAAVSTPHDALFKFVFSQPEQAASELRAVLPHELSTRLDWASLSLAPASFVDERLAKRHADLLFSIRCDGRDAFLYVLLEHQSTSDPFMAFRLLRYMVRIWDAFLRSHPAAGKLPAVIPVVIITATPAGRHRPSCPTSSISIPRRSEWSRASCPSFSSCSKTYRP